MTASCRPRRVGAILRTRFPIVMRTPLLLASSLLVLAACLPAQPAASDGAVSSSSVSVAAVNTVEYASYQGVLEAMGPGIYMEGTHRLMLADGRALLLSSVSVELNAYLEREVEVYGAVRDTVEAGGRIMEVVTVMPLDDASSSAESSVSSSEESSGESSASSIAMTMSSVAAMAPASSTPAKAAPKPAVSSAPARDPVMTDPEDPFSLRIKSMAKENYAQSNWTKSYCATRGFCMPIHRNFYYKSFGSTTSALWHIELSNAEMDLLGDGPISVNLVAGDVSAADAKDGDVVAQGSTVIGYRAWKDGQHIEIIAPTELKAAVAVLTAGITAAPAASAQ